MKTEPVLAAFVGVLVLIGETPAQADSFTNSPVTSAPVWWSPAPYQRDIDLTFSSYPIAAPGSSGIPGATYAGTRDPALKRSDYVTLSGAAQCLPSWTMYNIGVVNPGSNVLTGTATFNLGNMTGGQPVHVWVEALCFAGIGTSVGINVAAPGGGYSVSTLGANYYGVTYSNGWWEALYPMNGCGVSQFDCEYQITPNPSNEQIVLSFTASHTYFCDSACVLELHVATECVAPPAPPPCLEAPNWLADGSGLRLTVVGQAGSNYEIQTSESLGNWHTIGTLSTPQGTNSFTDTGACTNAQRFYRARLLQ